jgi:hypothetical protein
MLSFCEGEAQSQYPFKSSLPKNKDLKNKRQSSQDNEKRKGLIKSTELKTRKRLCC